MLCQLLDTISLSHDKVQALFPFCSIWGNSSTLPGDLQRSLRLPQWVTVWILHLAISVPPWKHLGTLFLRAWSLVSTPAPSAGTCLGLPGGPWSREGQVGPWLWHLSKTKSHWWQLQWDECRCGGHAGSCRELTTKAVSLKALLASSPPRLSVHLELA